MVGERLHDFTIGKIEQRGALVNQRDFGAESGEERSVFEADDAGADDDEFMRQAVHFGDAIGVHDALVVERNVGIARRAGAAGDQNVVCVKDSLVVVALNFDRVRVGELRRALENLDAVAAKLCAYDFRFT